MDDLTYYYLGRAAEGLGYTGAAMTYYKISERLTASGLTCNTEGANFCNGQFFPAAAQVRLVELTAPPPPPGRLPKTHTAQQRHRPPSRQAKPSAPAPAQNTAPATTGTAVAPEPTDEPTSPDFAAPPPIRR
jgi:hypothetical protein